MEEFYIDADGIKLHAKLDRPKGLERTPLCILIHGLTGHMEEEHIIAMQQAMNEIGVAVLRVEMYGHGKSGGRFRDHTLYKWINGALAVVDWAKALDWPTELYISGHSQGGYTTMLLAGLRPDDFAAVMPLSPAIVIEYGARAGDMLGMKFDPKHIPDRVYLGDPGLAEQDPEAALGFSFCGDYFRIAQTLHVDEAIARYEGPVLLVHGDQDQAVPVQYSIDAAAKYANAKLHIIKNDDHNYHAHLDEACAAVQDFLKELHG